MKKISMVLTLMLVVTCVHAAEVPTSNGDKALLFRFTGLSNLGLNGYEGGIGLRYYLRDNLAIRPGAGLSVTSSEMSYVDYSPRESSTASVDVSVVLEKRVPASSKVSPYIGFGGKFSYSRRVDKPPLPDDAHEGWTTKNKSNSSTPKIFGVLGFEWAVADRITIGGEYRLGASVTYTTTELERVDMPTHRSKGISDVTVGFSTTSVLLSLSW